MKTYTEMIDFSAKALMGELCWHMWVVVPIVAETFGVPKEKVVDDINTVKSHLEKQAALQRRLERRGQAEKDRLLANLLKDVL